MENRFWATLAGIAASMALMSAASAQSQVGEVPLQTYASFAETEMNFTVDLQKDGKAVFTWNFMGDVDKAQGTWEQQGSRITIKTKGRKRSQDAIYVFDYRSELKSPSDLYVGCKQFAEGLFPVNINNAINKYTKSEFMGFYAWPQKQIKSKNTPCLSKK